jgi:hypothetical protein
MSADRFKRQPDSAYACEKINTCEVVGIH